MDALEYLNMFLGSDLTDEEKNTIEQQQKIRAQLSGESTVTPQWADDVAITRATSKYQNYVKNNPTFQLGGKTYRWEEADNPQYAGHWRKGNSNSGIAEEMAINNHSNPKDYQGSYLNLINERERLTGKRYIPVRIN